LKGDLKSPYSPPVNCKFAGTGGAWKIYYKGVQVDSFDGHTKPIFKDPQKTIEKYEKRYQDIISHTK
jgi:hypothetical protein